MRRNFKTTMCSQADDTYMFECIEQFLTEKKSEGLSVETLKLSLELYKQGLSPFQNVLDAQRSLLSYENQLVQAQGSSLLQLISLYKALGGGWRE